MRKNQVELLGEVFRTSSALSPHVSRMVRESRARKLAGTLYTVNMMDPPETVLRRNLWYAVALLFPGAVISHRTGLELRPTTGGTIFLTEAHERIVRLPGLRVRIVGGPGPLPGDTPHMGKLWKASEARSLLECLKIRQVRGSESPGLRRADLEARLERIALRGEAALNQLRDQAREIAPALGAERAFEELNDLVGGLLGTRKASLSHPAALARAAGEPYDPGRLDLFQRLASALVEWPVASRPDPITQGPAWSHLAFFDAYFSNFIEGTEFQVSEAAEIVFQQRIPASRPEDAHDVLGTYLLVSSRQEMGQSALTCAADFEGFLGLLRRRHRLIMQARPDRRPGEFKEEGNRAGATFFVAPELVRGTLRKGLELFRALPLPFQRSAFMMFLVAEVHPFDDGNGRLARAMMNAELLSAGERRILIPTVFRPDYLAALKALSLGDRTAPLLRMLNRAQAFSARVDFSDLESARRQLDQARAFDTAEDALLRD